MRVQKNQFFFGLGLTRAGVTQPDIMLLAPIARLLDITLETLLSFHEELTQNEIDEIVKELDRRFECESYEEVFSYAKGIIQTYPNCDRLIWQLALILDARAELDDADVPEGYENQILEWYQRAFRGSNEEIRRSAAGSLFQFYMRKEMYDKAEEYIGCFSEEELEAKLKLAQLYSKTNRIDEAYKTYEEILFSNCQMVTEVFQSLYMLSMENGNILQARGYAEKQSEAARLFEMGKFYEVSCRLELAVHDKNVEETLFIVRSMLDSLEDIGYFHSSLYAHMEFGEMSDDFVKKLRGNLIDNFCDRETYSYMVGNEEWKKLLHQK